MHQILLKMATNSTKTKLSKEDICKLYSFLVEYENEIKNNYGKYDFNSSSFRSFCKTNNLKCEPSLAIAKLNNMNKYDNYFFFVDKKKNITKDNIHHLFRHIRNSIAHALVTKKKKHYMFKDKYMSGTVSMYGKIRTDLFDSFIKELESTKNVLSNK